MAAAPKWRVSKWRFSSGIEVPTGTRRYTNTDPHLWHTIGNTKFCAYMSHGGQNTRQSLISDHMQSITGWQVWTLGGRISIKFVTPIISFTVCHSGRQPGRTKKVRRHSRERVFAIFSRGSKVFCAKQLSQGVQGIDNCVMLLDWWVVSGQEALGQQRKSLPSSIINKLKFLDHYLVTR